MQVMQETILDHSMTWDLSIIADRNSPFPLWFKQLSKRNSSIDLVALVGLISLLRLLRQLRRRAILQTLPLLPLLLSVEVVERGQDAVELTFEISEARLEGNGGLFTPVLCGRRNNSRTCQSQPRNLCFHAMPTLSNVACIICTMAPYPQCNQSSNYQYQVTPFVGLQRENTRCARV